MKRRQPLSTSTRFAGVVAALRAAADWLRQAGKTPPRIEEDDARALGELYLQCRCISPPLCRVQEAASWISLFAWIYSRAAPEVYQEGIDSCPFLPSPDARAPSVMRCAVRSRMMQDLPEVETARRMLEAIDALAHETRCA